MSRSTPGRVNPVCKAMNRPLTVLGAERRLFFVALISGGAIFSLLHSLLGGSRCSLSAWVLPVVQQSTTWRSCACSLTPVSSADGTTP